MLTRRSILRSLVACMVVPATIVCAPLRVRVEEEKHDGPTFHGIPLVYVDRIGDRGPYRGPYYFFRPGDFAALKAKRVIQ